MNTTAAAAKAGVTVATIRHWCRYGAVAATKTAGRWDISEASLDHRIALGRKHRMDSTAKYQVTEGTNRYGTTTYTVTRTDGTPANGVGADWRISNATYIKRIDAETHADFLNGVPSEYRIRKDNYPARSIQNGSYWTISGSRQEDPRDLRRDLDCDHKISGNWPEGTTLAGMLIHFALDHAKGADERIAKKAAADAIAAAEAAVQEARAAQLAEAARTKGPLATERQVDYIMQLLAHREYSGEGGGFYYGPTDRAGVEMMSKLEASSYITSLKGDY